MEIKLIGGCLFVDGTKVQCPPKRLPHLAPPTPGGHPKPPSPSSPTKPPTDPSGPPDTPDTPDTPDGPTSPPGGAPPDLPNPGPGGAAETPTSGSDSSSDYTGSLTKPPTLAKTVGTSVTGKGALFVRNALYGKGAKPTLSELPIQGVYAAELANVGYELVGKYGPTKGASKVTPQAFAEAIAGNTSEATRAFAGELLPEFSDSNILIFRRADGHMTAAVRGTHTGSAREVAFDAVNIAAMNNAGDSAMFKQRYYSKLEAVRNKFGKPVDVIVGDSLGGHASISATDRGLAGRSVTLNPYIRPSEVGDGFHTVLRTPGDPALLSKANLTMRESTGAANALVGENTTIHVVPRSTGKTSSMLPQNRLIGRIKDHSTYNFIPEHSGLPVEQVDSLAPTEVQQAKISNNLSETSPFLEKPQLYKPATRAATVAKTVGGFAAGQVIGYYGAVGADKALTSMGVEDEFTRDVVDGAAANLTVDVAMAGAQAAYATATGGAVAGLSAGGLAASGAIGAGAGMGAYAGGVAADDLGLTGAGKTAAEVTGGGVNTLLTAVALTGPENPAAWVAGGILATEALVLALDKLFGNDDEFVGHDTMLGTTKEVNEVAAYMKKVGVDWQSLSSDQKKAAVSSARQPQRSAYAPSAPSGQPVAEVRQLDASVPIETY